LPTDGRYLETQVFGVFSLGYGRVGPTEARAGLIALNVALLAGATGVLDVAGLGVAALMLAGLGGCAPRATCASSLRESQRAWFGPDRTSRYRAGLRDVSSSDLRAAFPARTVLCTPVGGEYARGRAHRRARVGDQPFGTR